MIPLLRRAIAANPRDARAPYYLGNLLFDWQPAAAIELWTKAVALEPGLTVAWRNLAQAYSHKPGDESRTQAIACLEKAVAVATPQPTHLAELDQLYEAAGAPVEKRLALLERHQSSVVQKDEGLASLIALQTFSGRPDAAIALLQGHAFNVWEGGTRHHTGELWTNAHLARGRQRLRAKQFSAVLADFEVALKYPVNLRANERPRGGSRQVEVAYWIGWAHAALGTADAARIAWISAAAEAAPASGGKRGDRDDDGLHGQTERHFQALALRQLGDPGRAETILREIVRTATTALAAGPEVARTRRAEAHYLAGLGHAGIGELPQAREQFTAALAAVPDHLGAKLALGEL